MFFINLMETFYYQLKLWLLQIIQLVIKLLLFLFLIYLLDASIFSILQNYEGQIILNSIDFFSNKASPIFYAEYCPQIKFLSVQCRLGINSCFFFSNILEINLQFISIINTFSVINIPGIQIVSNLHGKTSNNGFVKNW